MLSTAAGLLSLIDISLRAPFFFFFFLVSWQLGACYPDRVMLWWVNKDGMELHTTLEDMHLQNKSVCEKEEKTKVEYTDRYCLSFAKTVLNLM